MTNEGRKIRGSEVKVGDELYMNYAATPFDPPKYEWREVLYVEGNDEFFGMIIDGMPIMYFYCAEEFRAR